MANPKTHTLAKKLAAHGRGGDSMLVHMTPNEVQGLQKIAQVHGGSLTVNPKTGLVEAGFLSSILPMLAGGIATLFSGGMLAPILAGAATNAAFGDKNQSLLARLGLGALGGAGGAGVAGGLSKVGMAATGATQGVPGIASTLTQGVSPITAVSPLSGEAVTMASQAGNVIPAVTGTATTLGGAGAPSLANIGRGLGSVFGSGAEGTAARAAFMKALPYGKLGLAAAAAPALGELGQQKQWTPPKSDVQYYVGKNGGWNGTGEVIYHPGVMNPNYHQGQAALTGQGFEPGEYSTKYPGQPETPTIGAKEGGEVSHFAQGGQADVSNVNDFINAFNQSVMPVPQNPAPNPAPTAMPTSTAKPTNPGINPTTNTPFNIDNLRDLMSGRGYGGANPTYSYDPTTKKYTQTSNGFEGYGGMHLAQGGEIHYAAGGKLLHGHGDGMSDSIPAVIKGHRPQRAALADGEFVVPADVVSHLGNGSTNAGAKRLYAMMDRVRRARTGNPKQGKQINADKFLPA
jgi:hypothetical protein